MRAAILLIFLIHSFLIFGQNRSFDTPLSKNLDKFILNPEEGSESKSFIPIFDVPDLSSEIDMAKMKSSHNADKPTKYAVIHETQLNFLEVSKSDSLKNGIMYRYLVESKGAKSLSFILSDFYLSKGATLFLYSPEYEEVKGSYGSKNNNDYLRFGTPRIFSDKVTFELFEPYGTTIKSHFEITKILHGILDKTLQANQTSCMVDINCPEGNNWQTQSSAVVKIEIPDHPEMPNLCSGTLINNTAADGTPYILTADHCISTLQAASTAVFIFDYENTGCGNSTQKQSYEITGSQLISHAYNTDFSLVRMNNLPKSTWNVTYAGWDRSTNSGNSGVTIHHPDGGPKKISTHSLTPTDAQCAESNYGGTYANDNFWRVQAWDQTANGYGVTEGGSSGGPLFNSNQRIIGQLLGGDCSNGNCISPSTDESIFGKFHLSWTGNGTYQTRLKDWLDPASLNYSSINSAVVCPVGGKTNAIVTNDFLSGSNSVLATNNIYSSSYVANGAELILKAGNEIELGNGFISDFGSSLEATIESQNCVVGCDPIVLSLVPNVFTPNGDGYNDEFCILANNVTYYEIDVYNQWGTPVYSNATTNSNPTTICMWDGAGATSGSYYYASIKIKSPCDEVVFSPEILVISSGGGKIGGEEKLNLVQIWPNPVDKKLNVDFNRAVNGICEIEILDIMGRQLFLKEQKIGKNIFLELPNNLYSGSYILRIKTKEKIFTEKFIVN